MANESEELIERLDKLFEETGALVFKDIQIFINKIELKAGVSLPPAAPTIATQMLQPIVQKMEFTWKQSKFVDVSEPYPGEIVEVTFKRKNCCEMFRQNGVGSKSIR